MFSKRSALAREFSEWSKNNGCSREVDNVIAFLTTKELIRDDSMKLEFSHKKIIICGLCFEVVNRDRNSRSDESLGRCDIKDLRIFIDKEMPDQQKEATLIHEWCHAVLQLNGIEHSETLVSVLAQEMYRVNFRL